MIFLRSAIIAVLLVPAAVVADVADTTAEIEYLLNTLGSSECTFVRNGERHNAERAEEHLRMKHRRGKRYVTTAETFIERLASRSSMSKKPYWVDCPDDEPVPSGDWLMQRLSEFRAAR